MTAGDDHDIFAAQLFISSITRDQRFVTRCQRGDTHDVNVVLNGLWLPQRAFGTGPMSTSNPRSA